jgi:hypothetical protein
MVITIKYMMDVKEGGPGLRRLGITAAHLVQQNNGATGAILPLKISMRWMLVSNVVRSQTQSDEFESRWVPRAESCG